LAFAAAAAFALAGIADLTGALGSLERSSVATRFELRHVARPKGIVIVTIDDASFGELGAFPFPRSDHGRVIERLHAYGAKQIVYDVQFTEPTTRAQDAALYRAIGAAGGATLATSESDGHGHTNVLGGDANLAAVHARAAAANLNTSAGGVITRYPYDSAGLKSLAVIAVARATGTPVPARAFDHGSALIDYRGGPDTFPHVPFWKVFRGKADPAIFRNKIVVVGATAPSLQDLHSTPTSGSDLMTGPEVQANAIWTALHGNPLRSAPSWLTILTILLAALMAPMLALRLTLTSAALLSAAVGIGYTGAAQLAFDRGTVIVLVAPLTALVLGTAGMLIVSYFVASSERRVLGWIASRRTEQLRDSQLEIITRLVQAAESRDGDTGDHINRIGDLCERLSLQLGFDAAKARMLRYASMMHDVGKIGIPDHVLLKPGSLDEAEWATMRSHTVIGAEILAGSTSPIIQMAEVIARTHHERWDGSGYPAGLRGDEIPIEGRICAICDVFDALGSERPYKDAWSPADVLAEIARGSGTHFDPAILAAFLAIAPQLEQPRFTTARDELDLASLPALEQPGQQAA
jgi:HD-GYP domain-containing protein (c-di-GMP phosphodiesterase class II)